MKIITSSKILVEVSYTCMCIIKFVVKLFSKTLNYKCDYTLRII